MDLGLHLAALDVDGGDAALAPTLRDAARAADEAGVAWLSLMDHWFQMEQLGGPHRAMLEGYTTLGYLAALTERVRLGLVVTGVTYRHPGLLAKTVTTLDVLSGGRAFLGLGAAWYEREHRGLGVPFPPLAERFERLEETLQVIDQMWSDDDGPWHGRHYTLEETICLPRPLQSPRPPVVIGGSGERKTLRLVATYADACNLFATTPEQVAHKIAVLDRHCADVGRDPTEVRRTVIGGPDPVSDPADFLRQAQAYADLGVTLVVVSPPPGADPAAYAATLGEQVVPALAEIG